MQRRARDDARVDLVERRLEGRHHRSRSATRSSRLTRVRRRPLTARFHVERALSRPSSRPPTAGRRGASRASPKRRGTRPEEDRGDEYYDYSYDPRDARARGSRDGGYYDGGYYDGGYYDGGPRAPSADDYERQAPPGGPPRTSRCSPSARYSRCYPSEPPESSTRTSGADRRRRCSGWG